MPKASRGFQVFAKPAGRLIANGIQTNRTLLTEEWCSFLSTEGFAVGLSLDGPQDMHDLRRVGG